MLNRDDNCVDIIANYMKGKDGEQGPQGPAGPKGDIGPAGPAGPAGPPTNIINLKIDDKGHLIATITN